MPMVRPFRKFGSPRLRAAPLFAFCLLRRGVSGHSRNAPLSIVCFMSFFGLCVFIRVLKRWCASSISPPIAWQTFQTTVSTSHCVRKELTATLCVRVWSWYDIAIKLKFFILLHSAVECTSLSMGLVLLRSKFRKVQRVGDDRECFAPHPLTKRGCCKFAAQKS